MANLQKPNRPIKSSTKASKKPTRKALALITVVLLLVVASISGMLLYQAHNRKVKADQAYAADKVTFAQLEKDMQVAYDSIVAGVGASQVKRSSDCSSIAHKYESGQLYCGTGYDLAFKEDSSESLPPLSMKIISLIQTGGIIKLSSNALNKSSVTDTFFSYKRDDRVTCELYGSYIDEKTIHYNFTCSKPAQHRVYPLAE